MIFFKNYSVLKREETVRFLRYFHNPQPDRPFTSGNILRYAGKTATKSMRKTPAVSMARDGPVIPIYVIFVAN